MYGRLFSAVLRLLPGNNYQSPDNPLQVDRLPNDARVELDYPVVQDQPLTARRHTALLICIPALAAPLLAWTAHLVPIPYIHGGLDTVALLAALALVIFGACGRYSALLSFAIAGAMLPIFGLLVRDTPFAVAALFVALIATVVFAASLTTNYVYLKTAAPVAHDRARDIRAQWRWRWVALFRPLRGSEGYLLGFLLAPAAGWLLLSALSVHNRVGKFWDAFRDFLTVAILALLWGIAVEALVAPLFGRRPYSLKARTGALMRALVEWCCYNRLNTRGVGVHRSPAGNCTARRHLLVGTVLAWACLWAAWQLQSRNLSSYLQEVFQPLAFQSLLTKWIENESRQVNILHPEPKESASTVSLTPAEQEMLRRLPSDAAEDYLRQRTESHEQQQQEQAAASDPEGTRRPGALLLQFLQSLTRVAIDVLVPTLCTLAAVGFLVFGMVSRSLAGMEAILGSERRQRVLSSANWELLVDRVRASEDEIEKTSIFLGANAVDDTPILVPREVFKEHAHILGDSGAGKTSMGLLPLISQLMRFGDSSVIVVDLKADDQVVFECLKEECDRLSTAFKEKDPNHPGYPFRWFTTVVGRSSFGFNPLTQKVMPMLTPDQRTDVLTAGLGLQYGTDYGRKFYGDANYDLLNTALYQHPNVQSFAELELALADAARYLTAETRRAASHVVSSARRLSRCKAFNACEALMTPQTVLDHAIDLNQVFTLPQALYLALPPASGISNTAEIARIFLYSLLATAQATPPHRRTQVYLIVDEFQRIVSNNVELFLQQARSMNVACIFSNQSLADLNKIDTDLIPAVRANTRFRQVFGAGNQTDLEDLLTTAGETVYGSRSWGVSPGLFGEILKSVSISERVGGRLSINDILLATDAPGRNITYVRRGAGYAQFGGMPFKMDSVHHTSKQSFEDRLKAEWPPADERMIVARLDDVPPRRGPIILDEQAEQRPASKPHMPDDLPGEETAEGLPDDLVEELYEQQQAEWEKRKRKLKSKQPRT